LQFLNSDEAWIESTSWGCPCEGLGVSAKISGDSTGFSAWANKNFGTVGFDSVPIDADAISATTSAIVNSVLKVTHEFKPSALTDRLYEVTVTFENLGSDTLTELRYKRLIDWDIPPDVYNECVSVDTGDSKAIEYASDNGFDRNDPLLFPRSGSFTCSGSCKNLDNGPSDHGAMFQFLFKEADGVTLKTLEAGDKFSFKIFYGGAPNKMEATEALIAVGAEVSNTQ
jgi:hypothetical protein